MNLGGRGCSEPRLCRCTPAWATEQDPSLKERKEKRRKNEKKKKKKERRKEKKEEGKKEREKEGRVNELSWY